MKTKKHSRLILFLAILFLMLYSIGVFASLRQESEQATTAAAVQKTTLTQYTIQISDTRFEDGVAGNDFPMKRLPNRTWI